MRTREDFGPYILLKKLTEDPLGETFRAGRASANGLEQVVLLRAFNGRAVDGPAVWQAVSGRRAVQEALKSPNIGDGVDLGEVGGVPFAAYDYISGRNLESLLIQAANANSPIPLDHALLITERASLALSVASETRAGGERVLHGFAVPHLVMVSNEGETRVLGFEMAPGLAAQASSFGREITRYLAPELVASGKAERSDDVWTLGATLFELLACQPLPEAGDGGYAAVVDAARVAYDGTPFPPEVAALLKKSLAPRAQRLADAGAWHKALAELIADGGHGATTFNLAFFMHNLFRREIEEESQEIERERRATPAAVGAVGAAAGAEPRPSDEPPKGVPAPVVAAQPKPGVNKALLGAIAAGLLVVVAAGVFFFFRGGLGGGADEAQTAASEPALPAPQPVAAQPAGPEPAEIQAQLAEMIDSRSAEMEDKLRDQYDERIRTLQKQLEDARVTASQRAAEPPQPQSSAAEREVAEAEAAQPATPPQPKPADAAPAQGPPVPNPGRTDGEDKPADTPAQPAAQPAKAEETKPAPKPVEPPAPRVRPGDLVGMGAGVTPPELMQDPQVRYPAMAKKLRKEAIVEVRVLVDENGNVRDAKLLNKAVGFGLDAAALDAAKTARYRPATKNGVKVKMYVNMKINFSL